jgi:DNA-binding response OmpR family regulator
MNRGSILIIEDDRDMCDELAELLALEGYSVDAAYNGREGKRLIDSKDYTIVLLDLKLPAIDGYELLRYIKRNRPTNVIVITGKPLGSELERTLQPEDDLDRAALELADGFAEKPFNIEAVLDSIKRATARGGTPPFTST